MQTLRNFVQFKNPKILSVSGIRSVASKARSMDFNIRKEVPLKHLFDGGDLNVYDTKIVNLSAGTPSENLLKDCCDIFKTATDHRMVRTKSDYTIELVLQSLLSCEVES